MKNNMFPYEIEDDFEAARIIEQAFPPHYILLRINNDLQVHDLLNALMYARTKCGNEQLGYCIEWSRKVIEKSSRQKA